MNRSVLTLLMTQRIYVKNSFSVILFLLLFTNGFGQLRITYNRNILNGADQLDLLLPLCKDKKIALTGNQTSILRNRTHLLDTLLQSGIKIEKIFTPEHGLRGNADAGEKVASGKDEKTGVSIVSLYGKNKKPSAESLKGVDLVLFDLQDVGARFYTYISTLHYVMEACAENNIQVIVLDRPNPNGFYVDGPVLDTSLRSFVGMHPVPIVHGMTIGEYAQMINGEKWLKGGIQCQLTVITCKEYTHKSYYELPVPPSPNLKSMQAIYYYPSTCLFEGTIVSVGRGTDQPFRYLGYPNEKTGAIYFTPVSGPGAKSPLYMNKKCRGMFLSDDMVNNWLTDPKVEIVLLVDFFQNSKAGAKFFNEKGSFNILAGTKKLKSQIISKKPIEYIRSTWKDDLIAFKAKRKKYLLYPDFE